MNRFSTYLVTQVKAIKPAFFSKTPHFSFITAHYFWVIGMTIITSIAIYASRRDGLTYIDALLFASGANTQAGLNPIDVNKLNTFQQVMIFLFSMISSPITLHGSVVYLRLYWFEKRFQDWVRDVRKRRMTLTKSRSKSKADQRRAEEGVSDRHIVIVTPDSPQRLANDGVLLSPQYQSDAHAAAKMEESDSATATDEHVDRDPLYREKSSQGSFTDASSHSSAETDAGMADNDVNQAAPQSPLAITFADTVKKSDGRYVPTKFPQDRANADHIAILERQRNQDNEVLRIPGPRDAERGMGPRRLADDDDLRDDDDRTTIMPSRTADSTNPTTRRPTAITIEEPRRRRRDELYQDMQAVGGTLDSLRFRKPRIFNKSQRKYHEDDGASSHTFRARTADTIRSVLSRDKTDDMPYLSYTPTVGRNSNFLDLTLEQREELGGIEYRSLRTLAVLLLSYFWGFQLLAIVFLLPYILHSRHYGNVVDDAGVSKVWWAFFTGNSAFMDLGFTLTPDSMNSFTRSEYVLMTMWFFIIIGNTGFPVMLRFIIWVISLVIPKGSGLWEETRFLLDHPRRCFTLLFPSAANWWLFWILVIMNAVDLLFFLILDLNSEVVEALPVHTRVVNGLFQAASTRTAGFTSLPLSALHPAMLVLYMIMMYISVFPIAISIRRTNVYEEKSLGVYPEPHQDNDIDGDPNALSYVGSHLRRQLSFDLWFIFLGLFILAITEGSKIQAGRFDLFAILFEIISAYGVVGLSLGVTNASLCSQFTTVGKLVIVAMQIRGRHRSLPYGLDRAVLLPREYQFQRDDQRDDHREEDAELAPSNTNVTATTSGMQRAGSTAARTSSMSRDRPAANLIVKLLHPGPAVPHGIIHHRRAHSTSSHVSNPHFQRSPTEPVFDEDEDDHMPPLPRVNARSHPVPPMNREWSVDENVNDRASR
ncbi:cation transport protein-domain-containing protein [Stachybotrys elegans]|uniref:Potassium transport protein n=1 Tax=Stachybotrys elegans TaxID=80388 RepID=A0A8K0T1F6_9HYPO|nr:cation transport protein-domain-containing protein [Stachybotrys elegans]